MTEPSDNGQGRDLAHLYERELDRLLDLLARYREEQLWTTQGAQLNSPGTLSLHLAGNILHYVGAVLGGTDYVRDRDREFAEKTTKDDVVNRVSAAREVVGTVLRGIDDRAMNAPYPGEMPEVYSGMSTRCFLTHLLWHLGWHQGHIYYHLLGGTESR